MAFAGSLPAQIARTHAAGNLTSNSAQLNGAVVGAGTNSVYYFEYGTDTTQTITTPQHPVVAPDTVLYVHEDIASLPSDQQIFYRAVLQSGGTQVKGEYRSIQLHTSGPPVVRTGETTFPGVIQDYRTPSVTLNGEVGSTGIPTAYYFEYGLDQTYGHQSSLQDVGPELSSFFCVNWNRRILDWSSWGSIIQNTDNADSTRYISASAGSQIDYNHVSGGVGPIQLLLYSKVGEVDDQVPDAHGVFNYNIGGGNPDLRDAEILMKLRNKSFTANGAGMHFWIQSQPGSNRDPFQDWKRANWAFMGHQIDPGIQGNEWRYERFSLRNDAALWKYAANNLTQLNPWRYSYFPLDSCLADMNYDFILTFLNLQAGSMPQGYIDFAEMQIRYRNHSLLSPRNGCRLMSWPTGSIEDPGSLTDGFRNGKGHMWQSAPYPTSTQEFVYRFDHQVRITKIQIHQNPDFPAKKVELQVAEDPQNFVSVEEVIVPSGANQDDNFTYSLSKYAVPITATYLKVRITDWYQPEACGLGEIEVFGDGGVLSPGNDTSAVNVDINNLEIGKTYHYRLVARNASGITYGMDQTFAIPSNDLRFNSASDSVAVTDSAYSFRAVADWEQPDSIGGCIRYRFLVRPSWLMIDPLTGWVAGTPGFQNIGDTLVTIQAFDNMGRTGTLSARLRVRRANSAPVFRDTPYSGVAFVDSAFSLQVHAEDPDSMRYGDLVRYRVVQPQAWLTIDSVSGLAHGVPTYANIRDSLIIIEAYDSLGAAKRKTFPVKINHINNPPIFVPFLPLDAHEDSLYRFTVVATDPDSARYGDEVRYRAEVRPSWLSVDSVTGVVLGIPRAINVGDTLLSVKAFDEKGGLAVQNIVVHVLHTNHPPAFASSLLATATEDSLYAFCVCARDRDSAYFGDVVRYRLSLMPSWLAIDSISGLLSGIPRGVNAGDTVVAIEAYDNKGGSARERYALTVTHVNHSPVISSTAASHAVEDSLYKYRVTISDVDSALFGDRSTFSLLDSPSWLRIDGETGVISGTPRGINVGDTIVTVSVRDGLGARAEQRYNLIVTHVNHNPVILSPAKSLAHEDSLYRFRITSSDSDSMLFGDCAAYSLLDAPSWLSIDSVTGILSGVPHGADVGDTIVTFVDRDRAGGRALQRHTLTVMHTNHAPVIQMPAAGTLGKHEESFAKEDSAYHLVVHAFDVDSKLFGDIVRYRFVRKPCWLTLDSLSGSITGIPHVGNGDTLFSVMAADGLLSDTLHVRVHVFHTNHPPVIESVPDTICYFGYRYSYQVVAPDPDTVIGDRRHYALIKSPRWLSIDSSGGLVSGTPPPSTSIHTDVIEVEVGDGAGAHVTQTFALRNSPRIGRGLESRIPDSFVLEQNYPNPFNPITRIVFGVPQTASVEVEIFNILGQSLCRLADGIHEPGYYAVDWDGNGGHAASGVYFVRIQARSADRRETLYITAKKMLLLK